MTVVGIPKCHAFQSIKTRKRDVSRNLVPERVLYLRESPVACPILFTTPRLRRQDVCVKVWPDSNVSPVLFTSRSGQRIVVRAVLRKTAAKASVETTSSACTTNGALPAILAKDADNHDESTASTQHDEHSLTNLANVAVAVKFIPSRTTLPSAAEQESMRREILCNLRLRSRLQKMQYNSQRGVLTHQQRCVLGPRDAHIWKPAVELIGYYLNSHEPHKCVLVTSLIWGVDVGQWLESQCRATLEAAAKTEQNEKSVNSAVTPFANIPRSSALIRVWIAVLIFRRVFQLHELGIRHNDLKPSNVMIDLYTWKEKQNICYKQHDTPLESLRYICLHPERIDLRDIDIKLVDLGNATPCRFPRQSGGTPAYLSPEQQLAAYRQYQQAREIDGSRLNKHEKVGVPTLPLDKRTDFWSLGLTIVEILTTVSLTQALQGTRPLKYIGVGTFGGWSLAPEDYIQRLHRGFFGLAESEAAQNDFLRNKCFVERCLASAALQIFNSFIQKDPNDRKTIEDGILILLECALQLQGIRTDELLNPYRVASPTQVPAWVDTAFLRPSRL